MYPNVRILVLGNLVAEGTPWKPIRFKPINVTELAQVTGENARRFKRDVISTKFPVLHRRDSTRSSMCTWWPGTQRIRILDFWKYTTRQQVLLDLK